MTQQVIKDDGNESPLVDHLRDEHKRGTRGLTDEYLADLHVELHHRTRDPIPEHEHPDDDEDDGLGGDRELVGV